MVALDECDPVTFNAAVGPDFCRNVTLGAFTTLSELFTLAEAGTPDPGWDFEPEKLTIKHTCGPKCSATGLGGSGFLAVVGADSSLVSGPGCGKGIESRPRAADGFASALTPDIFPMSIPDVSPISIPSMSFIFMPGMPCCAAVRMAEGLAVPIFIPGMSPMFMPGMFSIPRPVFFCSAPPVPMFIPGMLSISIPDMFPIPISTIVSIGRLRKARPISSSSEHTTGLAAMGACHTPVLAMLELV